MKRSRRRAVTGFAVLAVALIVGTTALSGAAGAATDGRTATAENAQSVSGAVAPVSDGVQSASGDLQSTSDGAQSVSVGVGRVADDGATPQERASLVQAVDPDRTTVDVALRSDGDAELTFEFRVRLEDDAAREAFESLQDDVAADPANYTADFQQRVSRTAEAASASTGREMAVENVTVATRVEEIPQAYGVLTYELRWTNFAAVEGEALHAGDAIDDFLMEEGTRLSVRWPAEYELRSATPEADDSTATRVTWRGADTEFVAGEPRVVVEPANEGSWLLPALGLAALLAVAALGWWLVRRGDVDLPGRSRSADAQTGAGSSAGGAGAGAAGGAAGGAAAEASSGDVGAADTDDGETSANAAGAAQSTDETADDVPQDLLTNEEQVVRVLEKHGGRAKQQQVVSELEWTEAKTSQVVTSMHDDGEIEKFRIGRENVLALPGEADL